jgi:hypothetical protein
MYKYTALYITHLYYPRVTQAQNEKSPELVEAFKCGG